MQNNKYSDLKLLHFPAKVDSFVQGTVTAPIYVRVKPINYCNHSCFWCVYHSPDMSKMHTDMAVRDVIPKEKMLEILDDFREMGVKALTFSGGGEPLLHRDIELFMDRTLELGIDLSIITNGSMLKGRKAEILGKAKWVRVSMDYSCAEEMTKFRGVHGKFYQETLDNISNFSKVKNLGCDLYVNYIVHADNCHNLYGIAKTLKDCGVQNVRFSPMWQSPDFHGYHAKIEDEVKGQLKVCQELVDDTFSVNTTYDLTSSAHNSFRTYRKCFFMQVVPVIGADQVVYACHNKAYDKTGAVGSIKERRFKELWFSAEARQVFDGLDPITTCQHQCANDSKNHLIHEVLATSVDNFV